MDKTINIQCLNTFIKACETLGDNEVMDILNNSTESLKELIITFSCAEFNKKRKHLYSQEHSNTWFKTVTYFLLHKYSKMSVNDLAFEYKKRRTFIYSYFKNIEILDPKIPEHKDTLDKLNKLEKLIIEFKTNNHGK